MALIVKKFGGSSVADAERVFRVAKLITKSYQEGNSVCVVLSAQGDTTDDLIAKAQEINPDASKREMDMLLACGEQISIALMAMAIEKLGFPVVSLCGWQVGMNTNTQHSSARIRKVDCERVREELDKKRIVLVAGFQGVNRHNDVTTLGRGGSDTTAVALAVALQADLCQIYTDVDGVYTCDPRIVPEARKLQQITYDEMLELASMGAQVLNNRSVELAKSYQVQMEVLSSFEEKPGTIVKEVVKKVEKTYITGVAQDKKIARLALVGLEDVPGVAYRLFSILSKGKIAVDMIIQSLGREEQKDIVFTVAEKDVMACAKLLDENKETLNFDHIDINTGVAKVSIVGAGMLENVSVAAKMFEALYQQHINIHMISTSEIKISVLIDKDDADRATRVIHEQFFQ
ncbi:MAG: aspartate kinase [Oscillospiraceae bacterium]|nr:aspartate kinase [Oscillospiraceae bacterium]